MTYKELAAVIEQMTEAQQNQSVTAVDAKSELFAVRTVEVVEQNSPVADVICVGCPYLSIQ